MDSDDYSEVQQEFFLSNKNSGLVLLRIETILENVVVALSDFRPPQLDIMSRNTTHSQSSSGVVKSISFPGRNSHESKKFARVLLILQLSHRALVSGTILTKRHIFYQHQDLFESQAVVDQLVDDIAATLQVNRDDLNIVASSKGLVCGALQIESQDRSIIDARHSDSGTPIPLARTIRALNLEQARWLVVVEKDAVFRTLVSSRFWDANSSGSGILVTAKGYPDLMTLTFLNLIVSTNPLLPIYVLTDLDPYGMNIYACYRYGSKLMGHDSRITQLPAHWLGVKTRHVLEIPAVMHDDAAEDIDNMSQTSKQTDPMSSLQCRNPICILTVNDRKFAGGMLKRLSAAEREDDDAVELRRELQVMLMMGVKAEIQWLDDVGSLSDWLDLKLKENV